MASTVAGARYLIANSHLVGLLVAAGGGGGESPAPPDPLLGASALRTLAKVLAKAARAGLNVSFSFRSSRRHVCSRRTSVEAIRRPESEGQDRAVVSWQGQA